MFIKLLVSLFLVINPALVILNSAVLPQQHNTVAVINTNGGDSASIVDVLDLEENVIPMSEPKQNSFVESLSDPNYLPIRDWSVGDPNIDAKAAIVFDTNKNKILYQKNIDEVLPIASVTKLMSAVVALENLDLNTVANVSAFAFNQPGQMGSLYANEQITIKNLMYAMLMESSNDAAVAIAESMGYEIFVTLMNQKSAILDMRQSGFTDPSGFDSANLSSVADLIKLVKHSLQYPIIWEILGTEKTTVKSVDERFIHNLFNNNKLLQRIEGMIGGKTGYTDQARGCMVVVSTEPSLESLIIIVLGSENRMMAIEQLFNWAKNAYIWE